MPNSKLPGLIADFLQEYHAAKKDAIWQQQSATFRKFWSQKVLAPGSDALLDEDCDPVIRIIRTTLETTKIVNALPPLNEQQGQQESGI